MNRLFFIGVFLVLLSGNRLFSQDLQGGEEPSHHAGAEVSFNGDDFFVGGVFYFANPFGQECSLVASVMARPYGKKVLQKEAADVYLYLREKRVSILVGVDKQFALADRFSVFASLLGGITIPSYRGTDRGTTTGMFPVVSAGCQWSLPSGACFAGDVVAFRLGGQYMDLPQNAYRITASILAAL